MRGHSRGALLLLTLCALPALLAATSPGNGNGSANGNGNGQGNGKGNNAAPPTPAATQPPAPTLPPIAPATLPLPSVPSPAPAMAQAPPQPAAPGMQAPAQGTQATGRDQAPADAATVAPSDVPMSSPPAIQNSSPARPPSRKSGISNAGLVGNGPSLNLFPGILVLFALLVVAAAVVGFHLPPPLRPSPVPGPGAPRLGPAAAAEPPEPSETLVPPPAPSEAPLPPLPAPGAEVFVADGTSAEDGSTGLTAQPRRQTPPTRL